MSGLRVAALFLGYGLIGFGGDYGVGLLAQDVESGQSYLYDYDVAVEVDVPEVVVVVEVADVVVEVAVTDVVVEVAVANVAYDYDYEYDYQYDVDIDHDFDFEFDHDFDFDFDFDFDAVQVDVSARDSGSCDYELDRTINIPVSRVNRLMIDAGAGELRVEGRRGLDQIEVVGRVCASREEWVEQLTLSVETIGSDVVLSTHYPDHNNARGEHTAKIDLTVLIPLGMDVDIDDSSGSMQVGGTGNLRIEDSSGSVQISGANGSVYLDDSSGGIEISDVAGDLEIRDGSGEIDVRDVQGTVRVSDGSGSIDIAGVEQDVIVEDDGSGSIRVSGVGGDFVVQNDGSGGISHSDVRGTVEIPEDKRPRRRRGGN